MRRLVGWKCLPIALVFLGGCASARSEPITGDSPLTYGTYSFEGVVRGQNRVPGRVSELRELVVGTLEIRADGSLNMVSSHGSCEGGQMVRGAARIHCRGVGVLLGPHSGTINLLMSEEQEVRTRECAEWAQVLREGNAQCVRYRTEIQTVSRWRSGEAAVTRRM